MNISDICMVLSSAFDLASYFQQLKRNKQRRSIHGLSFDFIFLAWLSYFTSVIYSINYYINPQIIRQFRKRNPVHSELIVSVPIILIDFIGLILLSGVVLQVFVLYHRTKNINQNLSKFSISFVGVLFCIFSWLVWNCAFSRGGFFLLDIIDYIWLISGILKIFRLAPQISLNWFCSIAVGIDDAFLICQWTSIGFLFLAKSGLMWREWYNIPVNYNTWGYLLVHTFNLVLFTVQKKSIYHEERRASKFEPYTITNINV